MSTTFPLGGRAFIELLKLKFPELAVNEDAKQRALTTKIGEQFCFSYGPQWGNKKRAGLSDDFRSKDSIAVQEADGTTSVWDMFQGNAEVTVLVHDGDAPTHPNLPPNEHTFMPCAPVNHLGTTPDPPPPPPPPPPSDNTEILARLDEIERVNLDLIGMLEAERLRITALETRVAALEAEQAKPLKVTGKTEATWGHQHVVNLDVTRVG